MNGAGGTGTAQLVEDQPERAVVQVDGDGGVLVLADAFAEGWTATLGGAPAAVHRANGLWRAVGVPAGSHEILFRYRTPGLDAGGGLSGLALAGCAALLLVPRLRRRRGPSGELAPAAAPRP